MIRGSTLVALAAVLLSLLVHGLGLSFTAREDHPPANDGGAPEMTDVGGGFQDFADPITKTATPEPAAVPDPPSVTSPQPVTDETPTSQALVASDTPQNVMTPDTGTAVVVEPNAAEPSESATPASETTETTESTESAETTVPSGGEDETNTSETVSSIAPTPAPPPSPAQPPEPEMLQPEQPEITIASLPDEPGILAAVESKDASSPAVTSSLRPPKERPSAADLGAPDPEQPPNAGNGNSPGVIESPLAAYKRSGVNPFTGGASGATGAGGSRAAGNSRTTNYVGQVLVQLNHAPVLYASAHGAARVQFQINPDGTLAWVRVLSSSGTADIERAARAQIQSAAPFPPPPKGTSPTLAFVYKNR
jgi:TonB family protein